MYKIIATTLFQNKICRLPGIGTLVMVAHSAESDFVNARIKSPNETIDFLEADNDENIFNEFSAMSELLQECLTENGSYLLSGIGTFSKNESGEIRFAPIPIAPIFVPYISSERVIRQHESHALLVGDQLTTNVEMNEYFGEQQPFKERWRVWAIVLAAIGFVVLLFYFYQHGLNGFGNITCF